MAGGVIRQLERSGYREITLIGSGGLGDVYRAVRTSTGHPVAVKTLRDISDASIAWRRAQREMQALFGLKGHPNVISVEEILDLDGVPAIIMEYLAAGSIHDRIQATTHGIPVGEAVLVGQHVAAALNAAHNLGIVHRDIKPQNLLVGTFGQIKVCDFGISALTRSEEFRTRTSAISYRYASPEELDETPDIGPPADIYSLGATLIHLLTGRAPSFRDRSEQVTPTGLDWIAAPGLPADVKSDLDQTIQRMLSSRPDQRPIAVEIEDSFDNLAGRLGTYRVKTFPISITGSLPAPANAPADHTATSAATLYRPSTPVTPGHSPEEPQPTPRHWRPLVGAGVGVAALLGAVAFLTLRSNSTSATTPTTGAAAAVSTSQVTQQVTSTTRPTTTMSPVTQVETTPVIRVERLTGLDASGSASIFTHRVDVTGLTIGDCFNLKASEMPVVVDCVDPHRYQYYWTVDLSDDYTDWAAFDQSANGECVDQFTRFVGTPLSSSQAEYTVFRWDEAGPWTTNGNVYCVAYIGYEELFTGDLENSNYSEY